MDSPIINNKPASEIDFDFGDIKQEQDLEGFCFSDQDMEIPEVSPIFTSQEELDVAIQAAAMAAAVASHNAEMAVTTTEETTDPFDMPVTGFSKKRKSSPSSGKKSKRSKTITNTGMPTQEEMVEKGESSDLVTQTKESFHVSETGKELKIGKKRFNFFLGVAFAMAGDYGPLLDIPGIDLETIGGFMKNTVSHYNVYDGIGYKDIIIRRIAFNDMFADSTQKDPTEFSKLLTKLIYGKSVDEESITKSNIRSMLTHIEQQKAKNGVKYLVDNKGTENFFHFRIGTQ